MAKEDKEVQPFEEIVDENEELGDNDDDENNNDQEESDMAKDTKATKRRREEIEDEEDEDEATDSAEDDEDEDESDDDETEDDDDEDDEVSDEFAQFKPFIVHEEQEWSLEEVLTEATPGEEIYFYVLENNHFYKLAPIKVGEVPGT